MNTIRISDTKSAELLDDGRVSITDITAGTTITLDHGEQWVFRPLLHRFAAEQWSKDNSGDQLL